MSSDGLSQSEKVNLLFKNYMNFTSTLDGKEFFEETSLSNNTNIFSNNILTKIPPTNPIYTQVTDANILKNYLTFSGVSSVNIDDSWLTDKTTSFSGTFAVNSTSDNDRTLLRLTKIKLDYLGGGSAAFICKDLNGANILQNLIPSNYAASGYSLSLEYYHSGTLKPVGWLATRNELSGAGFIGTSVNFGGALFDAKNGVVTFYDVNGDAATVFTDISSSFFLTGTKYIGSKGISTIGSTETQIDVTSANTLDFKTDNQTRMSIDTSNVTIINSDPSYSALDVSATSAIQFPVGTTAQRPNVGNGKIRYNSTVGEFEGYIEGHWKNLGGVIDVDKDTYISAETNPGTDNDEIKIYTGGVERIRVNANETINIYTNLDISGNLDVSGDIDVSGNLDVSGNFDLSGNCIIKNNIQVDGRFTSDIKMRGQKFRIQR